MPNLFAAITGLLNGEDPDQMPPELAQEGLTSEPVQPGISLSPDIDTQTGDFDPTYISSGPGDVLDPKQERILARQRAIDELRAIPKPQEQRSPWIYDLLALTPRGGKFASYLKGGVQNKNRRLASNYADSVQEANRLEDLGFKEQSSDIQQANESREADDHFRKSLQETKLNEPTSRGSMINNYLLKKYDPKFAAEFPDLSAAESGPALKPLEGLKDDEARARELSLKRSEVAQNRELGQSVKDETQLNKRFQDMGDRLSPNRRNPLLTKLQTQINQADALEALSVQGGKPINMNPQQMVEAARMLDSLLSQGGQATVAITNDLVPHSVGRNAAEILQWVSNKPQGTNQQAFVKYMMDTAQREKTVRTDQLRKAQAGSLPQYSDLKEKAPEKYNEVLIGLGFDPDNDFDEKGRYVGSHKEEVTPGTLPPDKQKRLEELRRKKAGK